MERLLMAAQEVAYRFSLLVCGHPEDAEDVMQDALIKTFRYVNRIQDPGAFRTWLYKTVRNACLMKRRRRVDEPSHHLSVERGTASGDGEAQAMAVPDGGRPADEQGLERHEKRAREARALAEPEYQSNGDGQSGNERRGNHSHDQRCVESVEAKRLPDGSGNDVRPRGVGKRVPGAGDLL